MSSTLLSFKREGALSLKMLQHKRASSSMQGRISWCAWRCGGKLTVSLELHVDLGEPLMSPQGSQISFGIARGTLGLLAHHCRNEYGLILSLGRNLRVPLHFGVSAELEQGSQASSCVEARNLACLLSCSWSDRSLVELYLEHVAFSRGCNRVSLPLRVVTSSSGLHS